MIGGDQWRDKEALREHCRRIAHLGSSGWKARKPVPRKTYGSCPICGTILQHRRTKTCSKTCGYILRKRNPHRIPEPNSTCVQCGKSYHSYRSSHRRYCSYQCHLDSGGALRAGLAACTAKMKYGAKKDANHRAIIDALRDCGIPVYDLSDVGHGVPDCIAWIKDEWRLVEIKNPETAYGRRGLNKIQKQWISQWKGGPIFLLHTVEEALDFAAGKFPQSVTGKE